MSIPKVLITAALAVGIPVAALAQSATEPARPKHDCGMMAAKTQALPPAPAGEAAPMTDPAPMACCLSRAASVDHSAHANMATPPAVRPMAGKGSGKMDGTAAGCCGTRMAAGEKNAAGEQMAARETMAAGKGKEVCCCAKTPTP